MWNVPNRGTKGMGVMTMARITIFQQIKMYNLYHRWTLDYATLLNIYAFVLFFFWGGGGSQCDFLINSSIPIFLNDERTSDFFFTAEKEERFNTENIQLSWPFIAPTSNCLAVSGDSLLQLCRSRIWLLVHFVQLLPLPF